MSRFQARRRKGATGDITIVILFVTALECEARAAIDFYGLKRAEEGKPRRVYLGDNAALAIAGVGRDAARAAAQFLRVFAGAERGDAWLNFGIAGAGDREAGEAFLAHKIRDAATGQSWFPALAFKPPCPTAEVVTVAEVERDFAGDALYEMEAAGFFEAASRFAMAELTHCFKAVSDNRCVPAEKVTAAGAAKLMEDNLETLDKIVGELRKISDELRGLETEPPGYREFLERWHFTATQRGQLRRALRRWEVLSPDRSPLKEREIQKATRGREVMTHLARRLDAFPVRLD